MEGPRGRDSPNWGIRKERCKFESELDGHLEFDEHRWVKWHFVLKRTAKMGRPERKYGSLALNGCGILETL